MARLLDRYCALIGEDPDVIRRRLRRDEARQATEPSALEEILTETPAPSAEEIAQAVAAEVAAALAVLVPRLVAEALAQREQRGRHHATTARR